MITETIYYNGLRELLVIKPKVLRDERGCFFETYNVSDFQKIGISEDFKQDNQSLSGKGVLRGLHFQNPPFEQGKLVRVVKGSVLDVVVDIRKGSGSYGKHFKIELSEQNNLILWIPSGFAHGFLSLEENTIFMYKCTEVYNKESEETLLWNDKELGIDWGIDNPIVSVKDSQGKEFKGYISKF